MNNIDPFWDVDIMDKMWAKSLTDIINDRDANVDVNYQMMQNREVKTVWLQLNAYSVIWTIQTYSH
jgi:hypothetical protein